MAQLSKQFTRLDCPTTNIQSVSHFEVKRLSLRRFNFETPNIYKIVYTINGAASYF